MKKVIFLFLSFIIYTAHFFSAKAQIFSGTPPAQHWRQINTDTARIIFPTGLDSQATRVASIVHYLAATKPLSLGDQTRKLNIVLQHNTVVPNGYVGLGPYRSEFFLTPDPNSLAQGSIPWGDQLAIHEYRHAQQYNNFNHGISRAMRFLFGQEGYALATNAAIPDWFFEGDAVYNETVLTQQGRGRLPLFLNAYPALWQSNKKYPWMKLRNGSLKDFVPSHYNLGYLLVNYGREKYGSDIWTKITHDASAFKGLFYPFQKAVRKYTGVSYQAFRDSAFLWYRNRSERGAQKRDEFLFPVNERYVTNYYFPYAVSTDSLLYLKASYRDRPVFVLHDRNGEHRIRVKDIAVDEQFSYRNGKIVYAAYETDPRWGWRDYSVIKMVDLNTGAQQSLSSRSKYFTPDISPDGSKIVAVQNNQEGRSSLHIIDATNGKIIRRIDAHDISLFTDPKFIDDQSLVTAVRLHDGKMALALGEIATGNLVRLTPPSFNVVGYPSVDNGNIFFTASFDGNDDIFVLRKKDNKILRVTNGIQGAYYVNAANGKLTWSEFTAEGYQLKQSQQDPASWKEISTALVEKMSTRFPVSFSSLSSTLGNIPGRTFSSTKYSKATNLFNFHSWRPYYEDPIFTFSLYGENVLNTFQTELYYLYNQNEKTNAVGFNAVYGGLFPLLHLGTEYTFNRQTAVGARIRTWDQLDTRAGLSIPIRKTKGTSFRSFTASSFYVLRNEFNKGFYEDSLGTSSFSYLQHGLAWSQQAQRAAQHIFPRWGYAINATYRHTITKYTANQFNTAASVYLPGLTKTHSLVLNAAWQERDTLGQVVFSSTFPYSRGYTELNFSRMWKLGANYHFPIAYPDRGIANIVYFQRIRGNIFYDFTKVYSRNKQVTRDQRSVGGELFFDTKWWNQYPLTFGVRVSKLLDRDLYDGFNGTIFEIVLPVSILPR